MSRARYSSRCLYVGQDIVPQTSKLLRTESSTNFSVSSLHILKLPIVPQTLGCYLREYVCMPIPETRQLHFDAGGLIKAPIETRKAVYESTQEMTVVVEDQKIGFRGGATLFLQHTCRTVDSNTTGCPAALGTGVEWLNAAVPPSRIRPGPLRTSGIRTCSAVHSKNLKRFI